MTASTAGQHPAPIDMTDERTGQPAVADADAFTAAPESAVRWGFSVFDARGRQLLLPRSSVAGAIAAFVNSINRGLATTVLIDTQWESLRLEMDLRIGRVKIQRQLLVPAVRPKKRRERP